MNQDWSGKKIRDFQKALLSWYRRHQRVLPWRSNPTPYRVWVAEIMLQQTRVQTVLPYYERFLKRFPDIQALARAPQTAVLEHWAGLGYYRRARNLQEGALQIMKDSNGRFPDTLEEIRRLPGVGRYTAAAIISIAFHKPEPVVDGNVRRILSRIFGLASLSENACWKYAGAWLARENPANFNQAMMELGALVCLPARPDCPSCPVRSLCRTGRLGVLPSQKAETKGRPETIQMVMLVVECDGKFILGRSEEASYIPGEWGLPLQVIRDGSKPELCASSLAKRILGSAPPLRPLKTVLHAITFRKIRAYVFATSLPSPPPDLDGDGAFAWHARNRLGRLLTSSLYRKGFARAAEYF